MSDLSQSSEAIGTPEWHKDILDERREKVAAGIARFEDWESAKVKIVEKTEGKTS